MPLSYYPFRFLFSLHYVLCSLTIRFWCYKADLQSNILISKIYKVWN